MDALEVSAGRLAHDAFDRLGKALIIALHVVEHFDSRVHGARIHRQAVDLFGQGLHVHFAVSDLHARAVQGVLVAVVFLAQFAETGVKLCKLGFRLVDIFAHLAHAVFLFGNIGEHAFQALLRVLPVGPQDCGEGFAFGCLPFRRRQAFACLLGLDVLAVHALADPLGRGIERFKLGPGFFQLLPHLLELLLNSLVLLVEFVKLCHPEGDLLYAQLIAQL